MWLIRLMHFNILSLLLWYSWLWCLLCIIACFSVGCHGMLPGVCLIWLTRASLGACYCPSCRNPPPQKKQLKNKKQHRQLLGSASCYTARKQHQCTEGHFSWLSTSSSLEDHKKEDLTWKITATEAVRKVHQQLHLLTTLGGVISLRKSSCPSTAPPSRPLWPAAPVWFCRCTEARSTSEGHKQFREDHWLCSPVAPFLSSYFWFFPSGISAANQPFPSHLQISSTSSSVTPTTFLSSFSACTHLSAISSTAAWRPKGADEHYATSTQWLP